MAKKLSVYLDGLLLEPCKIRFTENINIFILFLVIIDPWKSFGSVLRKTGFIGLLVPSLPATHWWPYTVNHIIIKNHIILSDIKGKPDKILERYYQSPIFHLFMYPGFYWR